MNASELTQLVGPLEELQRQAASVTRRMEFEKENPHAYPLNIVDTVGALTASVNALSCVLVLMIEHLAATAARAELITEHLAADAARAEQEEEGSSRD